MGHAGDGGGSIRIPAVGVRPGRAQAHPGPQSRWAPSWARRGAGLVARLAVTRSVRDTAALLDAVAGPGVGDPYWAPPPARPYVDEVERRSRQPADRLDRHLVRRRGGPSSTGTVRIGPGLMTSATAPDATTPFSRSSRSSTAHGNAAAVPPRPSLRPVIITWVAVSSSN